VSVSLLRAHDRFDFETGALTAAGAAGQGAGAAPDSAADVLSGTGVPDAMAAFARSGAASMTRRTRSSTPGAFDFVFQRAAETRFFAQGDRVSVDRLKLTVIPPAAKESR
jgi:hypothetical protein